MGRKAQTTQPWTGRWHRRRLVLGGALAGLLGLAAPAVAQDEEAEEESDRQQTLMNDEATVQDTVTGLGRPMPQPSTMGDEALLELEAFEAALSAYEAEIQDYRDTIGRVVEVEYAHRREQIRTFYNDEIEVLRIDERIRRNEAIADFQRFLERYPNDPEYTPDVMFRLAELFYEKAIDDYNQADAEYATAYQRYELGLVPEPPPEPMKDFAPTIELFANLIDRFPEYRQIDGAYYLTGICYDEMLESDEAAESFGALVRLYPESEFAQEAFLRIGEYHFDYANFELARTAYLRALDYGDSRWYDKIVFKLGWAHYLLNDYDDGIRTFESLLAYYEEGDGGMEALKEEALQYFAISVAEEDWDLDGETDPEFVMARVGTYLGEEEPWTMEVLDRLAEILMENQRFEYAVQVYDDILTRYPMDRLNPQRHEQILVAYARLHLDDTMIEEQRRLVELYGRGSDWYAEQERQGNLEAMAYADQLARDGLKDTAAQYYNDAFNLLNASAATGDEAQRQQALGMFRVAARLYEQFLTDYPYDAEAYTTRLFMAQSLYYAEDFLEAADIYAEVRDDPENDEFKETAGFFAIHSYELELERRIEGELRPGEERLPYRAWPANYRTQIQQEARDAAAAEAEAAAAEVEDEGGTRDRRGAADAGDQPDAIPELSLQYVAAIDAYIGHDLNRDDDPTSQGRYAYKAAEVFYYNSDYEQARPRFETIMARYCGAEVAGFAGIFLIESYRMEGDYEGVASAAAEVQLAANSGCAVVPDDIMEIFESELVAIEANALAQLAEEHFAAGNFEAAAQAYVELANQYADVDEDLAARGLFNAGLIYEQNLRQYDLAMRQFDRLILDYPESDFVDTALVRIAVNSKKFFDFDRAISTFVTLHDRGFSDTDLVEHPILDAAQLLEFSQRYEEAADTYMIFVREHPSTDRAPAALFKAAELYGLAGDRERMFDLYADFRSDYGREFSTVIDIDAAVIRSLKVEADYRRDDGETRTANRLYEQIRDEYARRNPTDIGSQAAMAEMAYEDAMEVFDEWNSITFGETMESQQEAIAERRAGIEATSEAFATVVDFNVAEWSVCAGFQAGQVYKTMAEVLVSLPLPDFGGDMYAEDEYIIMLEDIATLYEDAAVERWESFAYPLLVGTNVQNDCTINTMRELNRMRGSEYPVFREEVRPRDTMLFSPQAMPVPEAQQRDEQVLDIVTTPDLELDNATPLDVQLPTGETE